MKKINNHKYVFLLPCVLLIAVILVVGVFAKDISSSSETVSPPSQNISNNERICQHSVYFDFNDETRTIDRLNSKCKVEAIIFDVKTFSHDGIKVFDGEKEITEGYVKDGMTVQIFHSGSLYLEYTISNVIIAENQEPSYDSINAIEFLSSSNAFTYPIAKMSLKPYPEGNIYYPFNAVDDDGNIHRGIDITSGGSIANITNAPVLAIADGTVEWVQKWDGVTKSGTTMQTYGNCIRILHANGYRSLYAHMNDAPTLNVGDTVVQGQTIGHVGSTGFSTGYHLHLEISYNGELVDPCNYLTDSPDKNGWYRENGNTYYYENGLTKRGWWHLRSSSYYFDPDTGVMATGFTKIDTHYYYFYPSGDFDGTRGQLLTGWLDIYDNGELRYFYPDGMWDGTRGRMMYGFQPINGSTYFLDPDTGIMTKGWKAYPDSSSIYFFGDDGVMRTGWYHRSGSSTCHYFYPSTGKMALGLQEIEGHTFYFYTSGMWDGTRGQAMLGWQTVNGGLRYFYPSGDFDGTRGRMLHGFQTINGNTYFLDPDTGIRTVGWRAYPNSSSIYYFDEDGIMQTGWWHYTGKTTLYYFYDDGQLATGFTKLANGYYYFYPDGMWDGTRGQLMIGWQKVDGEWRYFYENGEYEGEKGMMHTYWLTRDGKKYFCDPTTGIRQTGLLNYPQGSTDYYYFDENGVMQNGSVNIDGKLYYFDKSTGRQVNYIFG